ncbi:MAG: TlpA family protein disulfide reductase [Sphingobacteriales bacterium]|nr:TlpA family protein disulfide reductase [Sphingobacteriales bacterium]OJW01966.1 MAG: hypothetical protein BGO52_00340 [Sphingobacteriales bacterium 44-61]
MKTFFLIVPKFSQITFFALCLSAFVENTNTSDTSKADITVKVGNAKEDDTFMLKVWRRYISETEDRFMPIVKLIKVYPGGGDIVFSVDSVNDFCYFTLSKNGDKRDGKYIDILKYYLLEKGDRILYNIDWMTAHLTPTKYDPKNQTGWDLGNAKFSGVGSAKYICKEEYDKEIVKSDGPSIPSRLDSLCARQSRIVEERKDSLTPLAYQLLKADIVGDISIRKLKGLVLANIQSVSFQKDSARRRRVEENYDKFIDPKIFSLFPDSIMVKSRRFFEFLVTNNLLRVKMFKDYERIKASEGVYDFIAGNYSGQIREYLLAEHLFHAYRSFTNGKEMLEKSKTYIKDPFLIDFLASLSNHLLSGMPAFNFSLTDVNGNIVGLKDFRGKVVVMDFWFTGCGPCTNYFRFCLSPVKEKFKQNSNVVFVTVSVDEDFHTWLKGVKSGLYTSETSVNLYTNGEGRDHPIILHYGITGYPRPMVFDKAGRIYKATGKDFFWKDRLTNMIEDALKVN